LPPVAARSRHWRFGSLRRARSEPSPAAPTGYLRAEAVGLDR
jgi:hypothetical protein